MKEINIGAAVISGNQEIGRIEQVILDCDTYEASHLVVKQGNAFQSQLRVMPIGWVSSAEHNRVHTGHSEKELAALPNFEVQHYARLDQLDEERLEHPRSKIKPSDWINYFVPLVTGALGGAYDPPGVRVTDPLLSANESAIGRGVAVESSDGHKVGEVQEVLFSEPDWRLSGVIIGRGFILTHPMKVAADWIVKITADKIMLNRTKSQVEQWEKEQV
ncbi:MAG: PRC-barrel domain-containing protein [Acidobacteria bacterium]|nr:PRC-barrel domain-containing protein [Acidobacteriota bacterium]